MGAWALLRIHFYRPMGSTFAANTEAYKAQLSAFDDGESDQYVFARNDESAMFLETCARARGPFQ